MNLKKDRETRHKEMRNYISEHRRVFIIYMLLRMSVIFIAIAQFFNQNYENLFLCILVLILFTVPGFIESNYSIDLPDTLEIIILLFIFILLSKNPNCIS